jgi:lysophospholipase L1-like esterase
VGPVVKPIGFFRGFFTNLAAEFDVPIVDMTDLGERWVEFSLAPLDGHASRRGNQLVAARLGETLRRYSEVRSPNRLEVTGDHFGDLGKSEARIWDIRPEMPYRVYTNTFGLRMVEDFDPRTEDQKILVLGDSFTFGPYLPNADTYPAIMNRQIKNTLVVNAGIAGYTITDERSLFEKRARHMRPDITILQVLDNDIYGFFYFKLNEFDRDGQEYEITPVERRYLAAARDLDNRSTSGGHADQ